jgi:hypothetical protein
LFFQIARRFIENAALKTVRLADMPVHTRGKIFFNIIIPLRFQSGYAILQYIDWQQ